MSLSQLSIDAVRNLSQQSLNLHSGANLLFGANGGGKTSVLESLHLLALGRSFRTPSARTLIQHGSDSCLVRATLEDERRTRSIAIQRGRGGDIALRVDGQPCQSLAELAALLPVVLIDTEGFGLISGSPDQRRRYLDRAVFHVEQPFMAMWRRYQRALKQRNAGLRRGTIGADGAWLDELSDAGEKLTEVRARTLQELTGQLAPLAADLSPSLSALEVTLRSGWDTSVSLRTALATGFETDCAKGFTYYGPHRADLKITVDGRPAADTLSRGQKKLAVAAMKLALGRLMAQTGASRPVYLVDDLAAELDSEHAARICQVLVSEGGQVVLTAVNRAEIENLWPNRDLRLFHVEHGSIRVVSDAPAGGEGTHTAN